MEASISKILKNNYMPYAMSVIVSRAIPEIDGFKPAHRKLLYTMYKMGLLKGHRTKSSNIVGQTMRLNPHGDVPIYETLVRLTSGNETLLVPYIDSKGNMGKHFSRDMAYAAHRYTEAKLSSICEELFKDIDKNVVKMIDNYDGTMKEPFLLPTTFPSILVNSNQGIAVGMACNIPSFNLVEVCETTIAYIKNSKINILDYLIAPDFTTGGKILYDKEELKKIYETGTGSFKIKGSYKIHKKDRIIEINEIPYTTTSEAIIDQIIKLVKSGDLNEINDIRDETDLKGLKIAIEYKTNANPEIIMQKIMNSTKFIDSFSCNFNMLIDGEPMVLGIKKILDHWLDFRIECIRKSIQYDLNQQSEKLHLLYGLQEILLDIDKAIKIIRETRKDKYVIKNLMNGFKIDEVQAEYVANIRLRNLNEEYILHKTNEITEIENEIIKLNVVLNNTEEINKIIISELQNIQKKYGESRRTLLANKTNVEKQIVVDIVDDYNLKLFLTKDNYIKKIPLISLRAAGENKCKEGDRIIKEQELTNLGELLVFTNMHNVYKIRLCDIEDKKASELGDYAPSIANLKKKEKIIFMHGTDHFKGYLLFVFENGKVAKVPLKLYQTKQNRRYLKNAYSSRSKIKKILFTENDDEYLQISTQSKRLIVETKKIKEKSSRTAMGNIVLRIKDEGIKEAHIRAKITNKKYLYKNIPGIGKRIKK